MNSSAKESSTSRHTTRQLLLGIWCHLNKRRRLQLGSALILMLVSGLAELVSLAAVVPFLAIMSDPQRLWKVPLFQSLASSLGISNAKDMLVPFALFFALTSIIAACVRLLNLWCNGLLAAVIGSDLSCDAYSRTLHRSYASHLKSNSSELITAITTYVGTLVSVLNAALQLATAVVVATGLLSVLIIISWKVAVTAIAVFGMSYILISWTIRRRLAANSRLVATASQEQLKSLQEGFGAIREVLLENNQYLYIEYYRSADRPMRLKLAQNGFLGTFPRFSLEAIGLVLIAIMAIILNQQTDSALKLIPVLGTLALGSQRLLPSFQQIYRNWVLIRSSGTAVAKVLQLLEEPAQLRINATSIVPLVFNKEIALTNVSFNYDNSANSILDGIDLSIKPGERIGLVGSTGSGKSTLFDIMMGLLEPSQGHITVDGLDLYDSTYAQNILSWRSTIAHVPQNIFLSDSSIAENIAFGLPVDSILMDKVYIAAQKAQISGFIESLPQGYATHVGERGVRLSGGQRQRIGIARALYKQSMILFLDEATSALDASTEDAVIEALDSLGSKLTILMIAHRLGTVERCDRIISLNSGRIVGVGSPSEILPSLH